MCNNQVSLKCFYRRYQFTIILSSISVLIGIIIVLFTGDSKMSVPGLSPGDPNSYSRPDEAVVTNIHLDLKVLFKEKILSGAATLTVEKKNRSNVILDVRGLNIRSVINAETGQPLKYMEGEPIPVFGNKLDIELPSSDAHIFLITILYDTSPDASALKWLTPEQTAGRKHPYLFSQCEPIHCRSLMPCQDTPSVKMTYSADIAVPTELVALMSAVRLGNPAPAPDGMMVYKFRQEIPIPSYLLAIAVGKLESRKLGPRSHVWAEKEVVDKAAYEFAETEVMLAAAEDICGPYVWKIYDLLLMPPSFGFGGMENPCLTFVTPTLLAGDRSLADVVAHEIAHSWTGNLVTNRNFEHFWMNEGFTVFVERKIIERLYGTERRHFAALGGLKELQDTINVQGSDDPLTCLVTNLKGVDPDSSFSNCPYEKGHTFLFYLEELLGGPDAFNPFLKAYIDNFKYKSIDTDDFKNYLNKYFDGNPKLKDINWNLWLHTPGMPPIIPKYDTTLAEGCTALAKMWIQQDISKGHNFSIADLSSLGPHGVREFLAQLLETDPLPVAKLELMRDIYKFNECKNSEILVRWLRLCIRSKMVGQVDLALKFATEQGRMKFVKPIFRELYAWPEARTKAIETFQAHRSNMMYVTSSTVAKELHLD